MGRKAQLKTRATTASVAAFLARQSPERRADCQAIARIMRQATGARPVMWGSSIVGFGAWEYQGRTSHGRWFLTGFSPRAQNLTLYIMAGFTEYGALLERLGKHGTGKSCLYIRRLADVDLSVLTRLIERSVRHLRAGGTPTY